MKVNKYILGVALATMALFTSCDTDNVATTYSPTGTNISFMQKTMSTLTSDASTEVVVGLSRFGTGGEYKAHYTLKTDAKGIFTDANNGEAVYADGQSMTSVVIKAANLKPGDSYTATLTLSDADLATADTVVGKPAKEVKITVSCDYAWKSIGELDDESGFNDGETVKVTTYEAKTNDGLKVYKFEGIFAKGYDVVAKATDATGTKFTVAKQAGWKHSSYGVVSVAGEGTVEGKKLTLILEHTVSAGSFGSIPEVITLP